ncbi:MAG: toll/interleukin-1 receptor domain-containing protein [Anaerolineaceae bacterium]|nr:toll/interleukin-1 receptor domain-containing protein [Anaerolineaceae bacterium]
MPPQNDEERAELKRLITQMRKGKRDFENSDNDEVIRSINSLRKRGWLRDFSLNGADLRGADLRGVDLSGAKLVRTVMSNSLLWTASLRKADLRKANLKDASLWEANLMEVSLIGADLSNAVLRDSNLRKANLTLGSLIRTNLWDADLREAILNHSTLIGADLRGADLSRANLWDADLREASLSGTNLSGANLSEANLSAADLSGTNLSGANLSGTNISEAHLRYSVFTGVDLSVVEGLEEVRHYGPSYIDYMTLYKSNSFPESFLEGCGVPELLRLYLPDLIAAERKLLSTFISYSHEDKEFARKLHRTLHGIGARVWLDEKRMKIGQRIYKTVNNAIHEYDRVILICSKDSLKSDWVDDEVTITLQRQRDLQKKDPDHYVLMPIRIDDYVFSHHCKFTWTPVLRDLLIGDFRDWEDNDAFQTNFELLKRSLQLM